MASLAALTGLQLLMLSELMLPAQQTATAELRSVLSSLVMLTKLVLRHCVVDDDAIIASNTSNVQELTPDAGNGGPILAPAPAPLSQLGRVLQAPVTGEQGAFMTALRTLDLTVRLPCSARRTLLRKHLNNI